MELFILDPNNGRHGDQICCCGNHSDKRKWNFTLFGRYFRNIYGLDSGNHVFRNGLLAERPGQLLLEEMVKGLIQINSITHKVLCWCSWQYICSRPGITESKMVPWCNGRDYSRRRKWAGGAMSQLSNPFDVSVTSDGTVYVLDHLEFKKWELGAITATVTNLNNDSYRFL
jgi:hypothetical protein